MSSVISFPQTRMITAIHLENVTEVAMEAFLRHTGATFWFGSVQDSGCYKVDDVVAHFYAGDYLVKAGQVIEGSFTPEEFAAKYQAAN
jgi:hypothetical protein